MENDNTSFLVKWRRCTITLTFNRSDASSVLSNILEVGSGIPKHGQRVICKGRLIDIGTCTPFPLGRLAAPNGQLQVMLLVASPPSSAEAAALAVDLAERAQRPSSTGAASGADVEDIVQSMAATAIGTEDAASDYQAVATVKSFEQLDAAVARARRVHEDYRRSNHYRTRTSDPFSSSNSSVYKLFGPQFDLEASESMAPEQAFLYFCVGLQVAPRLRCRCGRENQDPGLASDDNTTCVEDACATCVDDFVTAWYCFAYNSIEENVRHYRDRAATVPRSRRPPSQRTTPMSNDRQLQFHARRSTTSTTAANSSPTPGTATRPSRCGVKRRRRPSRSTSR